MTETKKAEKTARKDIRLSVRNFGPIAEAEIDLRPLTIFAGPSNTGKSYLAILLYSLFQKNRLISYERVWVSEFTLDLEEFTGIRDAIQSDENLSSKKELYFSDLSSDVKTWVKEKVLRALKNISGEKEQDLCRCMGISSLDDLRLKKEGKSRELKVDMCDDLHAWSFLGESPSINIGDMDFPLNIGFSRVIFPQVPELAVQENRLSEEWLLVLDTLLNQALSEVLKNTDLSASYFPAARTGIMQSYQAITGALISRATSPSIEDFPPLSGLLVDFLQTVIQISDKDMNVTEIRSIADDIEKDILEGEILVDTSAGYPRFSYKQKEVEVPLMRSSSMVSELAPVVLFLRNCVEEGDVFIIEEPEAHLHPAARRGIAKAIAKLVRAGVKVVITTHSDYILDQLSNYIRLEGSTDEYRRKMVDDENLYLEEEEVGCYRFKSASEGTVVEKVKFDKEIGILIDDHEEIVADLHNETVGILDHIFPD